MTWASIGSLLLGLVLGCGASMWWLNDLIHQAHREVVDGRASLELSLGLLKWYKARVEELEKGKA